MNHERSNLITRLRNRVALEQPADVADGAGGYTRSYTTIATVWAEILPMNGQEKLDAQKLQSSLMHRITIRYRTDVNATWRVRYGTRLFNIRAVMNNEERNGSLIMIAEEGVAV